MMRNFESQLNEILRSEGVQRLEWSVLYSIIYEPTITSAELAKKFTIEKSNMARVIKDLVHNGYLEIEQSTADKRRKRLKITEAGHQKYATCRQLIDAFEAEILQQTTTEEQTALVQAVFAIHSNLTKRAGM